MSQFYNSANVVSQTQIVNWLNEAGLADSNEKTIKLRKVQELIIHQVPHLVPTYLETILSYSADRSKDVKKQIISFIEELIERHPQYVSQVVSPLRALLINACIGIQKRVMQAFTVIYKQALMWICKSNATTAHLHVLWEHVTELKLAILRLIDSDNEGIRTNSIKFLEILIVTQTYSEEDSDGNDFSLNDVPLSLGFLTRDSLEKEAESIFQLLLKYHNSTHISSVNLMACMRSLAAVVKARPKFMPRVVQSLSGLYNTLPPTLTQSQVNSVRKYLKILLTGIIKQPSALEIVPNFANLLLEIGMTHQEISKLVPKERRHKRLYEIKSDDGYGKRVRVDSPQSNSQGSDRSDSTSQAFEESNDSRIFQPTVSEETIFEGIQSINNVICLVIDTMKNLPEQMPDYFPSVYSPISNAGSTNQKLLLSKLLASVIADDSAPVDEPPKIEIKEEYVPLSKDEKATLKNAVAKLAKTEKFESAVSKLMGEAAQDRESASDKLIPAPTPNTALPRLKQRVKLLKLQEITKPIPKDIREKLMYQAVERILKSDRDSVVAGVSHIRTRLLISFASSYNRQIREQILEYILYDVIAHAELAMSWLYEEYSYVQGFKRLPLTLNPLKPNEKHDQNYNNLLCALVTNIAEKCDPVQEEIRNNLLRRVFLEAPIITEEALDFLKVLVCEESKKIIALELLEEIIIKRPPKASKYVTALLCHTINEDYETREKATQLVVKIYVLSNDHVKRVIDKYAMLYLGFLSLPQPPRDLFQIVTGRDFSQETWTEDLYKVCLNLYLALFPVNEGMILELSRVYASASADAKRSVLRALEGPMRAAAASCPGDVSPAFLELLEECPRGAETLVTRIVHILTEKVPPSAELVSRVRDLYATRVSDVRFLIPVLNGLNKKEILAALPKLIKLNPVVVKEVFNKLLGLQSTHEEPLPVTPGELFVALHLIDSSKADLKYVIKATAMCFAEKQMFTQEVIAMVLQQLMELPEIPVLMMRTVLQALTLYPKLSGFILNILQRLITKEVWSNKVAWEGFIKCCERTTPQSFTVLLTLPTHALHLALTHSNTLMMRLSGHVALMTPAQKAHIKPEVMAMLSQINANPMPEVTGVPPVLEEHALIGMNPEFPLTEIIKDEMIHSVGTLLNEPLPPGMD